MKVYFLIFIFLIIFSCSKEEEKTEQDKITFEEKKEEIIKKETFEDTKSEEIQEKKDTNDVKNIFETKEETLNDTTDDKMEEIKYYSSCASLFKDCIIGCENNKQCIDNCLNNTSPDVISLYQNYSQCIDKNCNNLNSDAVSYFYCLKNNCIEELSLCSEGNNNCKSIYQCANECSIYEVYCFLNCILNGKQEDQFLFLQLYSCYFEQCKDKLDDESLFLLCADDAKNKECSNLFTHCLTPY